MVASVTIIPISYNNILVLDIKSTYLYYSIYLS